MADIAEVLKLYLPKVIGYIVEKYARCEICDDIEKHSDPLKVYCSMINHKVNISQIETIKSFEFVYLGDFKDIVAASRHLLETDSSTKYLPLGIKSCINLKKAWKQHFSKYYHLEGTFLFTFCTQIQQNNNTY